MGAKLKAAKAAVKTTLKATGADDRVLSIVDFLANMLTDNYVLGRDWESGCERYKLPLNDGRSFRGFTIGELNGWTFFVSNQIGPAGELYVGTLGAMKVLYDPQ